MAVPRIARLRPIRIMPFLKRVLPLVTALLLSALSASAFEPLPRFEAEPGSAGPGGLVITHAGTARTVTLAEFETLPLFELTGRTSPDEEPTRFQGVLLRDALRLAGAESARQITLRASDGYAIEIPREDWETWPVLLATRAEGQPITVRQRGPARILYPQGLYPDLQKRVYTDRSIWLLTELDW